MEEIRNFGTSEIGGCSLSIHLLNFCCFANHSFEFKLAMFRFVFNPVRSAGRLRSRCMATSQPAVGPGTIDENEFYDPIGKDFAAASQADRKYSSDGKEAVPEQRDLENSQSKDNLVDTGKTEQKPAFVDRAFAAAYDAKASVKETLGYNAEQDRIAADRFRGEWVGDWEVMENRQGFFIDNQSTSSDMNRFQRAVKAAQIEKTMVRGYQSSAPGLPQERDKEDSDSTFDKSMYRTRSYDETAIDDSKFNDERPQSSASNIVRPNAEAKTEAYQKVNVTARDSVKSQDDKKDISLRGIGQEKLSNKSTENSPAPNSQAPRKA